MRLRILVCFLAVLFTCGLPAFAQDKTLSLLGTWKVESAGGMLLHDKAPGASTHWEGKQTALTAQAVVNAQNGRFVSGTFTSGKASEKFVGMISADGKSAYFADQDGFFDAKVLDENTLDIVYRHVKPTDTVVAIGVWKRVK